MRALDDLLQRFDTLPAEQKTEIVALAQNFSKDLPWVPNDGPQTDAWFCEADEMFYGGSAGGGKSDLGIGLALSQHHRSLLLRRIREDARDLAERISEILGHTNGFNSQLLRWRLEDRLIDIGGCPNEGDKQRYKGRPHDLIVFDEIADFTESQYTFITIWNRSARPGQRCRVVATGNPPTEAEGLWIINRWAAWLDPKHPNPAKPGELRWYLKERGKEREVDGPGPHLVLRDNGKEEYIHARSRTFIRAKLEDNPDLDKTDYDTHLANLDDDLRLAYREGRFDASLKDKPNQVIPTSWVREAQERWTTKPPQGVPMCSMGVDPAAGGSDETVLSWRYDGWFAPILATPGKETPFPRDVAALVFSNRRDGAAVVVDMGGGYGGGVVEHLIDNGIEPVQHKGSESSMRRTQHKEYGFYNKRAEVYWKFREALDPGQPGGSPIMLPDDNKLVADLTVLTFEIAPGRGIKILEKDEVKKILGHSPDRGDAVVMAWNNGLTGANFMGGWSGMKGKKPEVQMGHDSKRRRK